MQTLTLRKLFLAGCNVRSVSDKALAWNEQVSVAVKAATADILWFRKAGRDQVLNHGDAQEVVDGNVCHAQLRTRLSTQRPAVQQHRH